MTTTAKTLEQTKGKFKVVGKIKGIDNEKAFRTGVTKNNNSYQSISFLVESSPNNTVGVELFGQETDTVLVMNFKEKDKRKQKKYVDWDDRYEDHGDYDLVGSCTVKVDASKKYGEKLTQYEAVESIFENFEEGDWVECRGQIDFESWETEEGEVKTRHKCKLNLIAKVKERDFQDEKFKEVNEFAQTIVVNEVEVDKETKRMYIHSKVIDYKLNCIDTTLAIDIESYKKLATNLKKRLKFGDQIRLQGKILNLSEFVKVDEEEDDEDWGGDNVSIEEEYQRNQIRELYVTGVTKKTHIEGKYTEEDLFNEDEENFGSDDDMDDDDLDDDDLDNDKDIDINDDDLDFDDD